MEVSLIRADNIVQSLCVLNDPMSTSQARKAADQYLFDCEKTSFVFLAYLLEIFETHSDPTIRLQALICFNNIVKRNWNNKRMNKTSPNFQSDKSNIKTRLVNYLKNCDNVSRKSLLDIIVFISKFDYPHNYEALSQFILEIYRSINNAPALMNEHMSYLKAVKEVYKQQMQRKSLTSKKVFGEVNMVLLSEAFQLFNKYSNKLGTPDGIAPIEWRVMRINDKILTMLLITGPYEIAEIEDITKLVGLVQQKLTALVQIIASGAKAISLEEIQKSIKSLLQYLGYLQNIHPYIFTQFLKVYLQILNYLYLNYGNYRSKDLLRFVIINLNKVMKCFNYYSDDASFLASSHSKTNKSVQYVQLHTLCRTAFYQIFTQQSIEKILSQTILKILSVREHQLQVGCGVQEEDAKVEDKENTIFNLTMYLIDTMFTRFSPYALRLFGELVVNSVQQSFSNLNDQVLNNILSILSILPKVCKGENAQILSQIPILQIIQHIHSTGKFKDKFALLCCKWLPRFSHEQLKGILTVLISYVQTQQKIQILMECCLAIKTIVLEKSSEIDVSFAVQKIIPVAIRLCSTVESVQVVWPMITLISKMISKVQFNLELLLEAFTSQSLVTLLQEKSEIIVEALSDMIKNLICVFPRNMPIPVIYSMAFAFLDNHVGHPNFASFPSVLTVWYIAIREYSYIQNLNAQATNLFEKHFAKLICTQNQTLLYILQEYVLLGLIQSNLSTFLLLLNDFYFEREDRQDLLNLKTAVLSVHITFISKFGIEQAHSNQLLIKYLGDMAQPDTNKSKSMVAFRNSLLTLINRYLILFKQGFLNFVDSIGLTRANFFPIWFAHMQYLTSRNACKINAIALLKMLNDLDISIIQGKLEYIFKLIVPEVDLYLKMMQEGGTGVGVIGKVGVSPTYRLSENILSERKEEIRRKGVFEDIDLRSLYQVEVRKFFEKFGLTQQQISSQFADKALVYKMFTLF